MRALQDPSARKRRYGFALTPLADAMFQLLIFFMLSSTLAPYSLLPLSTGATAAPQPATAANQAAPAPANPAQMSIWRLSRGKVRIGSDEIALSDLTARLARLKAAGVQRVLIFTTRAATLQDMTTALEVLSRGHVSAVQLVPGPAPQRG